MNRLFTQLNDVNRTASVEVLAQWLAAQGEDADALRRAAYECMRRNVGTDVYFRGLVEVSNRCELNCYYCGIRRGAAVSRYQVGREEILAAAVRCSELGFGSMVLQSGEIRTDRYVDFICEVVAEIKQKTRSDRQPEGVGVTLSLGVYSPAQYRRMFEAGAHRYLLRMETSDQGLFTALHPPEQSLQERLDALAVLKDVGFQVGTGVMIGLPGQSLEMLAADVLMFSQLDVDMVGMGPFLPSKNTPLATASIASAAERLRLGLNMISVTRLVCKDINIASTTALEGLHPEGRLLGLGCGANVAMPNLTPPENRVNYRLYDDKPMSQSVETAIASITTLGRRVALYEYGDSRHFFKGQSVRAGNSRQLDE